MKEIKQIVVAHGLAVVSRTGGDDSYRSRAAGLKRVFKELDEIGHLDSVAEAIDTINHEADFVTWIVVVAPKPIEKTTYQAFAQGMLAGNARKRVLGSFSFTSGEYFCLIMSTESSLDSFCMKLARETNPKVAEAVDTLIEEIQNT